MIGAEPQLEAIWCGETVAPTNVVDRTSRALSELTVGKPNESELKYFKILHSSETPSEDRVPFPNSSNIIRDLGVALFTASATYSKEQY